MGVFALFSVFQEVVWLFTEAEALKAKLEEERDTLQEEILQLSKDLNEARRGLQSLGTKAGSAMG